MQRNPRMALVAVSLLFVAQVAWAEMARAGPGSAAAAAASTAAVSSAAAVAGVRADFDGDGVSDLAIGVAHEDLAGTDEGAVNVIYGSTAGLSATTIPDQFWTQDSPSVDDVAESGDMFGSALATGDFNDDGFSDLAIGVPYNGPFSHGGVNVIHGSAAGLSATTIPDQFWTQDSLNVEGTAETADFFGLALTTGDFNGDGIADLAAGVPYEDFVAGASADGGVNVIYGSAAGLSATTVPNQFWSQDSPSVEGTAESDDRFGYTLAAGDFNGDGFAELAVGVHREDFAAGAVDDGGVNVIYGSAAGLSATAITDQFWSQDSPSVEGDAESDDRFGYALTTGDFNADGRADLALGVPYEDAAVGTSNDGGVNVIYGSFGGLSATTITDQLLGQDSPSINDIAESSDFFAHTMSTGDFNGDGYADLAAGVIGEDVAAGISGDGAVSVIHGSAGGLSATAVPDQLWAQDTPDVEGNPETGDGLGNAVSTGDFNGDGFADLAAGVPFEDAAAGTSDDGGVHVIHGSGGGLSATAIPDQLWGQDSPSVNDVAESDDEFGGSLETAT